MDRKVFAALVAFTILGFYLFLVILVAAPFWRPLAWAGIVAISTFPLYRRLRSHLGGRDGLAASIMTPAVVLVLVVPLVALIFFLTQDVTHFYQTLQQGAGHGGPFTLERLEHYPPVRTIVAALKPVLDRFGVNVHNLLKMVAGEARTFLVTYSTAILKNMFSFILKIFILVLALFFLYRDGEGFLGRLRALVPSDGAGAEELFLRMETVLSGVLYGLLLTCLVQGVFGGFGYWIAGLSSPALLGVTTAFAAVIPIFGTSLVWAPASLYLFFTGASWQGFFLLAWGLIVVGGMDNLLRPYLISGKGHVSFLVGALGVLGGVATFGFVGVVAGPILLALFLTVLEIYFKREGANPEGSE
jgi:predicted PurR-regulated permease PerM